MSFTMRYTIYFSFFFNATATTEIYTLSLHDALPIYIQFQGGTRAAQEALAHMHAEAHDFVIHVDVDVIAQEDFPPVNVPGRGALSFEEVQLALLEFTKHKNLVGLDIAQYNPD